MTTQEVKEEIDILKSQATKKDGFFDFGEFYGSLIKNNYKTARFEEITNFTMRKDNIRVSVVGRDVVITEQKNA